MKNMLPKKLEAIFLDFDGVVVDSTDIKTQAFYELYLPYGADIAVKAREYHLANQGVSRHKKFECVHRQLLNQEPNQQDYNTLSEKFSEIILAKIIICPLINGITEFLAKNSEHDIPVFLLSATPDAELKFICDKRDLSRYFTGIFGYPFEKANCGAELINKYNFTVQNIIFVGDSISDYKASNQIGSNFIGLVANDNINPFPNGVLVVQDFDELM
jgi:phosphoglycolate phosphatase-like HAD superfamily hydrolase